MTDHGLMADLVALRRHDHVAELVLDRADRHNALSTAMAEDIARACGQLRDDSRVRAVILSSASPNVFCVGADLKERGGFTDADFMHQRLVFRAAFGSVLALPVPTIAAVRGFALGGGFELALSCDLIVADETAVLGLPEVRVGVIPGGGGTQLLSRRAGPGVAADLIFTGRHVRIDEAERLRLIDRRVPAGEAERSARELAARIATNSPVAVRNAKRAVRGGADVSLAAGLDIEDSGWRATVFSEDRREGIAAFNEKRPPAWPTA
jgi:enoyl-CoA hydratase/carnithine racemase